MEIYEGIAQTPIIGDYTGTFADGNTVTLYADASEFGSKGGYDANKPYYWAPFDSSLNPSSLGAKTTWDSYTSLGLTLSSVQSPTNHSQSAVHDLGQDYNGSSQDGNVFAAIFTGSAPSAVYMSVNRYYDYDIPTWGQNHKMYRQWYQVGVHPNSYFSSDNKMGVEQPSPRNITFINGSSYMPSQSWVEEEMIYKNSSAVDVADGEMYYRQNRTIRVSTTDILYRSTAYPNSYEEFYIQDDISNLVSADPGHNRYIANLYVDNTMARVVVGDNATYASCATVVPQIPSAWSSNSITITVNQGTLNNFTGKHVFIFSSTGSIVKSFPI